MTLLYTARGIFNMDNDAGDMSWTSYIEWSGLTHLSELVSLDGMLNKELVHPNFDNADEWNYIHTDNKHITNLFTSVDYILSKIYSVKKFNFLAVSILPQSDRVNVELDDYNFVGYELLDKDYSVSALSNCGGFPETFSSADLNQYGLINEFENAYHIQKNLFKNNPGEFHADTNVIAVWRHKTIGQVM